MNTGTEFFPTLCRVYCTDCIAVLVLWDVNDVCPEPDFLDGMPLVPEGVDAGGYLKAGGGKAD